MTSEFTDFDDLTVDEAQERLADTTPGALRGVLAYERSHKDRVTLTRWIEERLDLDEDEDDEGDEPERIRVTNGSYTGYVAGLFFENPYQSRAVTRNARIERAIESGKISEVETPNE